MITVVSHNMNYYASLRVNNIAQKNTYFYTSSHKSFRPLKALALFENLANFPRGRKNGVLGFSRALAREAPVVPGQPLNLLFHLQFCNNRYSKGGLLNKTCDSKLHRRKEIDSPYANNMRA